MAVQIHGREITRVVTNTETLAGTKTLIVSDAKIQYLDPGGADRDVVAPAEASSDGLLFKIFNTADASELLTFKNDGGSIIAFVGQAEAKEFFCDGTDWKVMTEVKGLVNLIKNPFLVWSNSDTNKGRGTGNYDSGGVTAPIAGDTWTGNTSGATAKLISITVVTGSWAGGNAAGSFTLGACAGRFHDNETITTTTGGADTLTINMPDSAAGVDLVQNGDFSVDTDPPPGWTAFQTNDLDTEAGGKIGNCLEVNEDNTGANPSARQNINVTVGKLYAFTYYVKAGTEATYAVVLLKDGSSTIYSRSATEETAGDWSTGETVVFEAPVGITYVQIVLQQIAAQAAGTTMLFDEISLYEIDPCCTAADTLGPDGWTKTTVLDIYRVMQDTTHLKSLFGLQVVKTVATDEYLTWEGNLASLMHHYYKFRNQTWTFGIWVYSVTAADNVKIQVADSVASSSGFAAANVFTWLEIARGCGASITIFSPRFLFDGDVGDIAYLSEPMLIKGSSIGEGNYVPAQDKVIWLETAGEVSNTTLISNESISATTNYNTEAISQGIIPKDAKALHIAISGKCSTADKYLGIGPILFDRQMEVWSDPSGVGKITGNGGWIQLEDDGDFTITRNDSWTGVAIFLNGIRL